MANKKMDAEKAKAKEPEKAAEPVEATAAGPTEATVAGPSETPEFWQCPHCRTRYNASWEVAKRNHLQRVHGK